MGLNLLPADVGYDDGRTFMIDDVYSISFLDGVFTVQMKPVRVPYEGTIDRATLLSDGLYQELSVTRTCVKKGDYYTLVLTFDLNDRTVRPPAIKKRGVLERIKSKVCD